MAGGRRIEPVIMQIPEEWSFARPEVASAFDRHVREQLPWYDLATGIVVHIARHYVPNGGRVVDVGASTGNIGRALAPMLQARAATFLPIDNSPDMAKVYDGPGLLEIVDAVDAEWAPRSVDLVVCFLSLMFVPVALRRELVQSMVASVRRGGAV